MIANLLKPKVDLAALMLRFGVAAIVIVHGAIKIAQNSPLIPEMTLSVQKLVGWTELIAGIALTLGLFSRLAALAIIPVQVGAIVLVTQKRAMAGPSFERWGVDFMKVGPEFNGILIIMCLCVVLLGSGLISLDHCLLSLMARKKAVAAPESVAVSV